MVLCLTCMSSGSHIHDHTIFIIFTLPSLICTLFILTRVLLTNHNVLFSYQISRLTTLSIHFNYTQLMSKLFFYPTLRTIKYDQSNNISITSIFNLIGLKKKVISPLLSLDCNSIGNRLPHFLLHICN